MTSNSVGSRLVQLLVDQQTPVFGVPGGQTLPLYGATASSGSSHVVMRDERNAACAADGFARATGRAGLCDATVGPGVTNLVSGLAEAHASSIPVVAVIADIRRGWEHLRRRSVVSQAIDQRALLEPVTKWVGRVSVVDALDDVVDHAVRVATTGRPGPVAIEIPEDVFLGEIAGESAPARRPDAEFPRYRSDADPVRVEHVAELIRTAERPVLLAGGGVVLSGAAAAVGELAARHGIPVVTTLNGKGSVDERAEVAAGVAGGFGTVRGNAVLAAADLVLAIGTKFDQLTTHGFRVPRADQAVVHVDVDGEEIGRAVPVQLGIVADAQRFAVALDRALGVWSAGALWSDTVAPSAEPAPDGDPRVHPGAVVDVLDELLGADDLLVCDASLSSGWAARHFRVKRAGVGMIAPRGLGGLGWAPGAAIGARMGRPEGRIVVLTGDGAWGYGMAEVETAARWGLDIAFVVLNNATLGWIRHTERAMGLPTSASFTEVDFAAAGRALGARGAVVREPGEIAGALEGALNSPGPAVVDVRSSVDASPMVRRGQPARSVYA